MQAVVDAHGQFCKVPPRGGEPAGFCREFSGFALEVRETGGEPAALRSLAGDFVALGLQLGAGRTELMLDGGDRVLGVLDSVFERRHVDDSEGDRKYGDEE